MADVSGEDVALVQRVDGLVRARGVRLGAWCGAIGVTPESWRRWRSGVAAPSGLARTLCELIEADTELIGQLMERAAQGVERG